MTRARNTADTQTASGGPVSPGIAGKNFVINGGMDIWQRGTSFTPSGVGYTADRWYVTAVSGMVVSQETSTVPTGQVYAMKIAANNTSSYCNMAYTLESAEVARLAGKTVTFSALIQANANFNGLINAVISTNTVANTQSGGTWTAIASTSYTPAVGSWTTVSVTVAVPTSIAGLRVALPYNSLQSSASSVLWISQVQLEVGSTATPFSRAGGTIQGKLAACQRYYYRNTGGGAFSGFTWGYATSTTNGFFVVPLPVAMRVNPTSLDFANLQANNSAGTSYACSSGSLNAAYQSTTTGNVEFTLASSPTAGTMIRLMSANNVNAYIGFSAEL